MSRAGELAEVDEVEPRRPAARELAGERGEVGGERQERSERLEVLRRDGRHVDGVRDEPALERGRDLLGDDHAGAVLRLLGRRAEVRRDDDVLVLEQRPGVRLGGEHVDRGARDLAGVERLEERVLVDELAARDVDDADPVLRRRELLAPEQAARLLGQRQVEREEVRRREHLLERARPVDAERPEGIRRDVRVVGERRASRARAPGARPAGRSARSRRGRASCRRARARRSATAPSGRSSGRRGPAGCCARARAGGRSCARPPR